MGRNVFLGVGDRMTRYGMGKEIASEMEREREEGRISWVQVVPEYGSGGNVMVERKGPKDNSWAHCPLFVVVRRRRRGRRRRGEGRGRERGMEKNA